MITGFYSQCNKYAMTRNWLKQNPNLPSKPKWEITKITVKIQREHTTLLFLANCCSCVGWFEPYRKVPKFSDARKLCCNLPKIQRKRPKLKVFCQKDANGIANSEDPQEAV